MREPVLSEELPDDFELESRPGGLLALARDLAPALRGAGYGLDSDGDTRSSSLSGRKPLLELPTTAGTFLVRRFAHGGLLRFLTRERFHDLERPFHELSVSRRLARAGIGTPDVAAARARSAGGFGWRLEIVTKRIEGAVDLDHVLAEAGRGRIDRPALGRLARSVGLLVRALHAAGCRHPDLTTKNMLVARSSLSGPAPKTWILDLDRASLVPALTLEDRWKSLARLRRYVLRRRDGFDAPLATTDWARFLVAYEPDRLLRRAHARAVSRSHSRTRVWHALGWRLERLFSRRP